MSESIDASNQPVKYSTVSMAQKKHIALVAHDHKKDELLEWALQHRAVLVQHEMYATGTTGTLLTKALE